MYVLNFHLNVRLGLLCKVEIKSVNVCPGFAQAPEEYRGGEQWLPIVGGRKAKTGKDQEEDLSMFTSVPIFFIFEPCDHLSAKKKVYILKSFKRNKGFFSIS